MGFGFAETMVFLAMVAYLMSSFSCGAAQDQC